MRKISKFLVICILCLAMWAWDAAVTITRPEHAGSDIRQTYTVHAADAEDDVEDEEYYDDDNLYLPVNVDYDRAYEVISSINSNRSKNGVSQLTVDQTLMDAALIRATETIVYFEHARPNGGSWSSVSAKVMGENLGRGTSSVSKIMQLWMDSPGHRENILRSEFRSVGAACVEHEGTYYWVQLFGTSGGSGAERPSNATISVALDLPSSDAGSSFSYDYEIAGAGVSGSTEEHPAEISVGSSVRLGLYGGGLSFDPARLRWKVSEPEIASVDEDGVLHIDGRGRARITAYSGSIERADIAIDSRTYIGDKSEVYILEELPFVTVLGRDGPLRKFKDYSFNYVLEPAADGASEGADETEGQTATYAGYTIRGLGEYKGILNRSKN